MFYKIEESVGQYYIVLEGIYTTREDAEAAIQKYSNNSKMRVVPYVRNGIYGSVRVE
jgi:septal ring-binding cell division protein DamX